MPSENIFELKDISKVYDKKTALSPLSLNIKRGEIVALIGPSGAGKTTLLNILARVLPPDSGSLVIDGLSSEAYKNGKAFAGKVGIIRQQFDLVGQLPVIHNVLAGRLVEWGFFKSLLSLVIPQDRQIAANALQRVGLLEKIYEKTSKLSGGEQQRVALARLLTQGPEAILADEPVSSLDPARAEDILSILTRLAAEDGVTLVTVLHSVEYARKYFNRIIGMRDGKIQFDLEAGKVSDELLSSLYDLKEMKDHEQA